MIRPVEQHERIHPRELPDRVHRTEGVPDAHGRDFSLTVRQADEKHRERARDGADTGEDRYEASEQSADTPESEQHPNEKHDPEKATDQGGIDITV
jgi:hypothetical protein